MSYDVYYATGGGPLVLGGADVWVNHWIDNIEESFNLAQQNSLSLKIIYYLDYLYLRK